MNWKSLRKGWTSVHFIHGGGWTDLHATDTRFKLTDRLELAMSLDSNLRVRSATKRSDAAAFAEKLGRLTSVQITDGRKSLMVYVTRYHAPPTCPPAWC